MASAIPSRWHVLFKCWDHNINQLFIGFIIIHYSILISGTWKMWYQFQVDQRIYQTVILCVIWHLWGPSARLHLSHYVPFIVCHSRYFGAYHPDNKDHGANMGPTWVLSAPGGPHVGPMNLVIRVSGWSWFPLWWSTYLGFMHGKMSVTHKVPVMFTGMSLTMLQNVLWSMGMVCKGIYLKG